jgi:hypothetical protein
MRTSAPAEHSSYQFYEVVSVARLPVAWSLEWDLDADSGVVVGHHDLVTPADSYRSALRDERVSHSCFLSDGN